MAMDILNIYPHPEFQERAKHFYEKYDLKKIVAPGDPSYSKRNLTSSNNRICRFCGFGIPGTSFSNFSHLVPKLIGNTDLYSNFECDKCNEQFSVYENDLAEFLGVSRSISGLKNKKVTPSFTATRLRAKSRSFIGDNILIIAPEDVKREGNRTTINYLKNSFTPSNVYKALLKSALSLLSDLDVKENYLHAINYLAGKMIIDNGAIVGGYKLSFQLNLPLHIYLFQKKNVDDKIPTDIAVFYFQNNIITLPLPLHQNDIPFYRDHYDVIIPPPYFINKEAMEADMPISFMRDLSSDKKIVDEEEQIIIQLNNESLRNASVYNPSSDQIEQNQYDPVGIKYIIVVREGMTVDPKEFHMFIRDQMERNNDELNINGCTVNSKS